MREGCGRGSRPLPGFRSTAAKTTRWATFFKYYLGCTQKLLACFGRGPNMKWKTHILKGGAGRAPLASPLATTLVCVRRVRGGSGQDFSNSCRSRQKISTVTRLCCRKTAAPDKTSDADFICSAVNTFQLKFQLSSTDIFIIVVQ